MNPLNPHVRHDAVILFSAARCNPNGDPQMDNRPRIDTETNHGIVTAESLKRHFRDYMIMKHNLSGKIADGENIYVSKGPSLANIRAESKYGLQDTPKIHEKKSTAAEKENHPKLVMENRANLIKHFLDVRLFGAVTGDDYKAGQVQGPVQVSMGYSESPINIETVNIGRVVKETLSDDAYATTFGSKQIVDFGLYRARISYVPGAAIQNGWFTEGVFDPNKRGFSISEKDMELFWTGVYNMFNAKRTSSKELNLEGLHIFSHNCALGNMHAHQLDRKVKVDLKETINKPRSVEDYSIVINQEGIQDAGISYTNRAWPEEVSISI